MGGGGRRYAVIYDGACGMCRRSARLLRSWDREGRIELIPFQADAVPERFPDLDEAELRRAVHVVAPDGRRWSGADAVEQALHQTPRGRRLTWLFRLPLGRPVARRVYRWIARNRSWLGRFF